MSLRNDGLSLLNIRISLGQDGRMPAEVPAWWEQYKRPGHDKWTVVRYQPRSTCWMKSTHPNGTTQHKARYQLVATHMSGFKAQVTVWECGRRCVSPATQDFNHEKVKKCWACSRDRDQPRK